MHARTAELREHLDRTRCRLQAAVEAVAAERRDTRPADGGWSVAEVLSHLAKIEPQVVRLMRRKFDRKVAAGSLPPLGDDAEAGAWRQFAERLLDRETRIAAPDFVQPATEQDAAAEWRSLLASRPELLQLLMAADGLDTDAVRAPHVVLGLMTFEQWIAFVGFHEERHAMQIEAMA